MLSQLGVGARRWLSFWVPAAELSALRDSSTPEGGKDSETQAEGPCLIAPGMSCDQQGSEGRGRVPPLAQ